MISPIGNRPTKSDDTPGGPGVPRLDGTGPVAGATRAGRKGAFTLIELILVMAVLVIALSVAAPSLSRFFRGRTLDSEAKRFLALTRYAQSRAVSDGVPVELWMDAKQAAYGLVADSSYLEHDPKALEYQLNKDLQMEVQQSSAALKQASLWKGRGGLGANLPRIRFTPEGFISASSPEYIVFRQSDSPDIWIGPNPTHLGYEIQTNQLQKLLR